MKGKLKELASLGISEERLEKKIIHLYSLVFDLKLDGKTSAVCFALEKCLQEDSINYTYSYCQEGLEVVLHA